MADEQARPVPEHGSSGAGGDLAGGDETEPGSGERAARPRRGPWVLLAVLALGVGALAGWSARAAVAPVGAPVAAQPPTAAPTPAPGVPCPAAADAGAAIRAQLDRAVGALRDFDPGTLQGVLDEVQRQQARLEAAVAACGAGSPPP